MASRSRQSCSFRAAAGRTARPGSADASPAAASPTPTLTAHGTLIAADSEGTEGYCTLDGQVMTAKGDDGTVVGAQKLEKAIRDPGECTYNFSFPVKDATVYTFNVGTYRFLTDDNQKVAADLAKNLLFVIT